MADGGPLEDVLGGGEAEAAQERAEIAGADAIATSIAMDATRYDPELSRKAGDYLDRQARFVDIQAQDLIEQRALQTSHLKLRRFTERLKAATQVLIVFIAALVGLGIAIMLADAFTSRSVVVDAFKAPAVLAPRGLTGDVVAAGVLDQLQKLKEATRSTRKTLNTTSAWSSDITIQAPGTGVSIGEIERLLHARFGHDVHVGGDLVQSETGGLALTVRGDGVPAKTFQGATGDLDALTVQAAEYVYGRSQPDQFATYLTGNGRFADAVAFIPGAAARARDDEERAQLANALGNAYGGLNRTAEAAEQYRLAMALAPYNWKAWGNLVGTLVRARDEEMAWRVGEAFLSAAAKSPRKDRPELRFLVNPADVTIDLPLELVATRDDASHNGGAGASSTIDGPTFARLYARMHDPASEARSMAASDPENRYTQMMGLVNQGEAALDRGDAAAAIAPLAVFWKAWQAHPVIQASDDPCSLALAYAQTGRMSEADAVFKRVGPFARCYALHGDALEHAGDLAGALRVWAQGIAVAPDLSTVYLHRGLSELNRGDLAAAGADVAAANARSPHWADPLKAWGDLLARQGRWQAALAKYDQALRYAPAWKELRQARAVAAGKH